MTELDAKTIADFIIFGEKLLNKEIDIEKIARKKND